MSNDKTTKPLIERQEIKPTERAGRLMGISNSPNSDFGHQVFNSVNFHGWEIKQTSDGPGLIITAPNGKRIDVLGMVMSEDKRELEVRCK